MDLITTTSAMLVGKQLLGKTLDVISDDIAKIYTIGRDKIIEVAVRKTKKIDDGFQSNLRVTREVFWNGSFTDEAICAEYFGGILSSSRSKDGKDDAGVYYVDLIKSLSSTQLLAHYIIYKSINQLLTSIPDKHTLNCGSQRDLLRAEIYFSFIEFGQKLGSNSKVGPDLFALSSKGLVHEFESENHKLEDGLNFPYLKILPSPLGIQLYAISNNNFDNWQNFSSMNLGEFKDIDCPPHFTFDIKTLLNDVNLK